MRHPFWAAPTWRRCRGTVFEEKYDSLENLLNLQILVVSYTFFLTASSMGLLFMLSAMVS